MQSTDIAVIHGRPGSILLVKLPLFADSDNVELTIGAGTSFSSSAGIPIF